MKIVYRLLAVILLTAMGLSLVASGGGATQPHGHHRKPDITAIDAFVKRQMETRHLPGVAVAVTKDDEVLHVRGYGETSTGEPVTEDTPFRVASVSKSFTSLAVMQLVEDGKIEVDEPVKKYLPGFETADSRSEEITVRELLDQTSGMADGGFAEVSLPQPSSLEGAVARLRAARLVADPGTEFNYHNPNYQVAARLVEVVSDEPFGEYLKRHVFGPLGMDDSTTTAKDDRPAPGLGEGHSFAYGRPFAVPGPGYFVQGSGGVVSTASDMARWLAMQNNGGVGPNNARVVSASGVEEMHTPSAPGGYALGWFANGPKDDPTRIDHGGCCFAWGASEVLLPRSGHGVVVLFDSASPLGMDEANVAEGVVALVQEKAPQSQRPSSSTVDLILGALSLVSFALGALGVLRSGRWAARREGRPAWRVVLPLLPQVALLAACSSFPALAGFVFGGRDVTWFSTAYNWPALQVLVVTVAFASASVVAARVIGLMNHSSSRAHGAEEGFGEGP